MFLLKNTLSSESSPRNINNYPYSINVWKTHGHKSCCHEGSVSYVPNNFEL